MVKAASLHGWDVTPDEAARIQKQIAGMVSLRMEALDVRLVAGADCSYRNGAARAAVVVCSYPALEVVAQYCRRMPVSFPYIAGLFAFREGPPLLACFEDVTEDVGLVFFNGHGIAHPARCGLASHLGVLLGVPSIGIASAVLSCRYHEPPAFPGASTFLHNEEGDAVGHALRLREGSLLFVSPGHKIDLRGALSFTLSCLKGDSRLPVPLLHAHRLSKGDGNRE